MNSEHMVQGLKERQAQHTRPTPRVGGAAVIIALLIGAFCIADRLKDDLIFALLPGLLVFAVGLREDISRDVSPKMRLLATFAAALIAIFATGLLVPGLGLEQTDFFFEWPLVALAVTLLWSAGTCHAVNLIDGLNGLASSYAILAAIGLYAIAGQTGDHDIQNILILLIAALLGFLVLNWPLGLIFMGDAGAYAIGHILAWLSIVMLSRNPDVAGFALLLVLFWPVGETLFSVIRRRLRKQATNQPDRMHFHHLVVRALPVLLNRQQRLDFDNSLATLLIIPLLGTPILCGVWFWEQPVHALFSLLFFTTLFIATYAFSNDYFRGRRASKR